MTQNAEMRRSPRLPTRLAVRWMRRSGDIEMVATNVNMGGLFVETDEVVPVNHLVKVEIVLPTSALTN